MDVNRFNYNKKTKYSLVFFCFLLVFACEQQPEITNLNVNYNDDKAIGVSFVADNNQKKFSIHLKDNVTPVLGNFSSENNTQTFTPIVPFSNGETYTILREEHILSSFTIKPKNRSTSPEVVAIYPTTGVVPENLLKMYVDFSKPMQEVGNVLDFITVFNKTTNKKVDVFLELETELWNANHTLLTLWLDPGRIKKELIPNKEKGLPIMNGHVYEISVNKNFRDADGNELKQSYTKTVTVTNRDENKPKVDDFEIQIPTTKTSPLIIQFNEPLDAMLLTEVFTIYNNKDEKIEGNYQLQNEETSVAFTPTRNWKSDTYKIEIQSRLEDLAGNNLNRLFDEDLLNKDKLEDSPFKEIYFVIK
ncbi:Ig-like domain-containing protein [Aureibaculum conchae]|uniref:Ig-like domain-containing protein n=1 Tax=Aureibaculum sp. 2308TA14-22 TaxID=3108392 RepID=UPI00339B53D9